MKKRKIFLSIILALCLVVTLLPIDRITSFATEAAIQETTETSEEEKKEEIEAPAENEKDADEKETDIEEKSDETVVQEETSEVQEFDDNQSEDAVVEEDNASDNEAEVAEDTAQFEKETYSLKEEKSEDSSEAATKKKCDPEKEDTKEEKSLNNIRTLRVTKVWLDDFNRDGIRPRSVKVQLYQNGRKYGKEITLSAITAWTHIYRDLPIVNTKGIAYVYTVKEVTKVTGYLTAITADLTGYNIVNMHIPEKTKVSVSKVWDDNNDQDGKRPNSIKVQLYADGIAVGKPVVLNEKNQWNYKWKYLLKYKHCRNEINYEVKEISELPKGYTSSVTDDKSGNFTITNLYTPETLELSGMKKWEDDDNRDGKRPDKITVRLLADGIEVASQMVTAEDGWSYLFSRLPKYKNKGKEIVYTLTEDAVDNYATYIVGTDIINAYTPEKTSVTVTKYWDDNNNQDGVRPESITVQLYSDNNDDVNEITLSDENQWTYTWTDLLMYEKGEKIEYKVKEIEIPESYKSDVTGDAAKGYTIINSHIPETLEISGRKTWIDDDDKAGKRPDNININLLANGEKMDEITVSAEKNWEYSFGSLPKYKDGKNIEYTITENEVDNYTSIIDGFDVINTYNDENNNGGSDDSKEDVTPISPTTPESSDSTTEVSSDDPSITTENPDGETDIDDDTSINNDDDNKVSDIKDSDKTSPKTGDTSPIGIYVTLLLVAMAGIIWICFGKEKRTGKHSK